ncbi:hypothetical protein BKA80DRAFT_272146, partial [Phyllosticta citrichinensis]
MSRRGVPRPGAPWPQLDRHAMPCYAMASVYVAFRTRAPRLKRSVRGPSPRGGLKLAEMLLRLNQRPSALPSSVDPAAGMHDITNSDARLIQSEM